MIKEPHILLSYINTKLRDFYGSLEDLVNDLDLDKEELENILASISYYYNKEDNQFERR